MTAQDFTNIIDYILKQCVALKNQYVEDKDLKADYICIFSHNNEEYLEFLEQARSLGRVVEETPTGPVFAFNVLIETIAGKPKMLKIRKPDESRPQKGDVDFNTDYKLFKKKYFDGKKFTLIERENFEMLELRDDAFDVLVYFSSTPLSKQLGV